MMAEIIGYAINHNNLAVLELKSHNFQRAYQSSKQAVVKLEPFIFNEIKPKMDKSLKNDKDFIDKL